MSNNVPIPLEGDIDYLPGIVTEEVEPAFADVVREAFRREKGCKSAQDIAAILSVTKGAISQLLNDPAKIGRDRLAYAIEPLSGYERERIIAAWSRARRPPVEREPENARQAAGASDQLYKLRRPDAALEYALKALQLGPDRDIERFLLGRTAELLMRLDRPGDAMEYADRLQRLGTDPNEPETRAYAAALKARAARQAQLPARRVDSMRRLAEGLLELSAPAGPLASVAKWARDCIDSERAAISAEAWMKGSPSEEDARKMLDVARERIGRATTGASIARAYQLEASAWLALGDFPKVETAIERSFNEGGGDLAAGVRVGLLRARLLAARGDEDAAALFYRRLVIASRKSRELYISRRAQLELSELRFRLPPD